MRNAAEQGQGFRTTVIRQAEGDICSYFKGNTTGSKNIRNTVNFLIRNCMTAVSKPEGKRTDNEKAVLDRVASAVSGYNRQLLGSFEKRKRAAEADGKDCPNEPKLMEVPGEGHWMLSYGFVDYLLKTERNEAYYSTTSQVNQQAIRKTMQSWKAYLSSLKAYRANPSAFTNRPKLPGYIRTGECTAHFTNQVCRLVTQDGKAYLRFTGYPKLYPIGPDPGMKLVKVEVVPRYGVYYLHITYETGWKEPEAPSAPGRAIGIDPGLDNFATVTNNIGLEPFILDGRELKSANRWYNKARAEAMAILTAGHDPRDKTVRRDSRKLRKLSEDRDNRIRDWFYRMGHYIMRYAKANGIEVIVVGHNEGQKQGASLGKQNNQNFVGIPYSRFIRILRFLSCQYNIPVVVREESYTSKASLLDLDLIPDYGAAETAEKLPVFSGKRVRRGLYRSGRGILINADVNGAGNILRKEYPGIFAGQDLSCLVKTTRRVTLREVLGVPCRAADRRRQTFSRKSRASRKKGQDRRKLKIAAMAAMKNKAA